MRAFLSQGISDDLEIDEHKEEEGSASKRRRSKREVNTERVDQKVEECQTQEVVKRFEAIPRVFEYL
jgi:hypothetical protein